jgi:hypothetical protein
VEVPIKEGGVALTFTGAIASFIWFLFQGLAGDRTYSLSAAAVLLIAASLAVQLWDLPMVPAPAGAGEGRKGKCLGRCLMGSLCMHKGFTIKYFKV